MVNFDKVASSQIPRFCWYFISLSARRLGLI